MTNKPAKCIYCQAPAIQDGEGDHVIPAALGEWRGDTHFFGICDKCNREFGKCEEQLIRCGPIAEARRRLFVQSRRSARSGRRTGAGGLPASSITIEREGILARLDWDEGYAQPAKGMIAVTHDNTRHFVPMLLDRPPEVIRRMVLKKVESIEALKDIHFTVDDDEIREAQALVLDAFPEFKLVKESLTDPGVYSVDHLSISFHENLAMARAIGKIGFHFLLANRPELFQGDEDTFSEMRSFLRGNSGQHVPIYKAPDYLVHEIETAMRGGELDPVPHHALAVLKVEDLLIAGVGLFRGSFGTKYIYSSHLGPYSGDFEDFAAIYSYTRGPQGWQPGPLRFHTLSHG